MADNEVKLMLTIRLQCAECGADLGYDPHITKWNNAVDIRVKPCENCKKLQKGE